jgi:hypothetical protein
MTFLQLASRLRQEVGGAGTGPSAVTGQTGELKRIVDWIATADEDVQRKRNEWKFMRSGFTVNTVADTAAYAFGSCTDTTSSSAITLFREWVKDTFKIYLTSSGVGGETPLNFMYYDAWYSLYSTGTQTSAFPRDFTILNNRSFSLGPKPNAVYTVTGEYQKAVTIMTANGDVPVYPAEYHMLPVYAGMMSYGVFTGASEMYQRGSNLYRQLMAEMERTQLPDILLGEYYE